MARMRVWFGVIATGLGLTLGCGDDADDDLWTTGSTGGEGGEGQNASDGGDADGTAGTENPASGSDGDGEPDAGSPGDSTGGVGTGGTNTGGGNTGGTATGGTNTGGSDTGGTNTGGANTGGTTTGGAGTGGTSPGIASLGQPCDADADCEPAICIPPDLGAPHGMCTVECTDDADCPQGSLCLTDVGMCLEACTLGPGEKCRNRADLACMPVARLQGDATCTDDSDCSGDGVCSNGECRELVTACWFSCAGDFDCDPGLRCDFASGLCTDVELGPDPIGAECDPDAAEDTCNGLCMPFIDENAEPLYSACFGGCTFGRLEGCGWDGTGPADAACLVPRYVDGDIGDLGQCVALCDCNAECAHPDAACFAFAELGAAELEDVFGRRGICEYAYDAAGNPVTVPQLTECE